MKKVRGLGLKKNFSGRLYIVEGCDGSGKSTQVYLLKKWLESQGYFVFFTEWNSSDLLKTYTKKAKRKNLLTPTTFSLIHACDFADRYEKLIQPHLRAGHIVLCDRYVYTAYARDIARGCDPEWLHNLYNFAVRPTTAFYFKAPLDISLGRILTGRSVIKYHEAGMDLGLSKDPVESFKLFQGIIKEQYDNMAEEEGFIIMDATKSIEQQQTEMRAIIEKTLVGYRSPIDLSRRPQLVCGGD
ncbi:MAG TPA: dTMP kinase [Methanocella sp.]|nr:dTMP kinase [Methanocella sp.]